MKHKNNYPYNYSYRYGGSSDDNQSCENPFIDSPDKPRPLLPNEFNCYKALHYIKGCEDKKQYEYLIIIVDATKQRDTTITNTLISEYTPNKLCGISHPIDMDTVIQNILPNNFDMANEDALFSFQTTLSNNYRYQSHTATIL